MSQENSNKPKMMRLNVNISEEEYTKIQALAQQRGGTLSDFVRVALTLGEIAFEESRRGHDIGVVSKDGELLRQFVIK